jgi:hypothetical protein
MPKPKAALLVNASTNSIKWDIFVPLIQPLLEDMGYEVCIYDYPAQTTDAPPRMPPANDALPFKEFNLFIDILSQTSLLTPLINGVDIPTVICMERDNTTPTSEAYLRKSLLEIDPSAQLCLVDFTAGLDIDFSSPINPQPDPSQPHIIESLQRLRTAVSEAIENNKNERAAADNALMGMAGSLSQTIEIK